MLTLRDCLYIEDQLFAAVASVSETGGCSLTDCADMATRYAGRLAAEYKQLLMLHESLLARIAHVPVARPKLLQLE